MLEVRLLRDYCSDSSDSEVICAIFLTIIMFSAALIYFLPVIFIWGDNGIYKFPYVLEPVSSGFLFNWVITIEA